MAVVDLDTLVKKADQLRHKAKVDQAIAAYLEVARVAGDELPTKGYALHMAGVSAKQSVVDKNSPYYRDAFGYFVQAEGIFKQLNDAVNLGNLYRDMAIIADYADDFSRAPGFFQKSLDALSHTEAYANQAITYDKLGLHHYLRGDYHSALQFIDKGLSLFQRDPTRAGFWRATTLYDKARVLFKLNRLDEAVSLGREALSWFEADHEGETYQRRLAQLHGFLAVTLSELSALKQAKEHYQKYQRLLKSFDHAAQAVIRQELEELTR